jgi:hypothetical protein
VPKTVCPPKCPALELKQVQVPTADHLAHGIEIIE